MLLISCQIPIDEIDGFVVEQPTYALFENLPGTPDWMVIEIGGHRYVIHEEDLSDATENVTHHGAKVQTTGFDHEK